LAHVIGGLSKDSAQSWPSITDCLKSDEFSWSKSDTKAFQEIK